MPKVYKQLERARGILEKHYRDMQDMEFTVEEGTLYMLQTRTGKRTPAATFRIAVDMVKEGLITKKQALDAHHRRGHRAPVLPGNRSLRRAAGAGAAQDGCRASTPFPARPSASPSSRRMKPKTMAQAKARR